MGFYDSLFNIMESNDRILELHDEIINKIYEQGILIGGLILVVLLLLLFLIFTLFKKVEENRRANRNSVLEIKRRVTRFLYH